jgi:hypothetical protein
MTDKLKALKWWFTTAVLVAAGAYTVIMATDRMDKHEDAFEKLGKISEQVVANQSALADPKTTLRHQLLLCGQDSAQIERWMRYDIGRSSVFFQNKNGESKVMLNTHYIWAPTLPEVGMLAKEVIKEGDSTSSPVLIDTLWDCR